MGSAVGSAGLSVFGSNCFLRSLAHFVISSRVPDVWNVGKPREPAEDPDSRPCSCRVLCCVCSPLNPYGEKMTTSPDTRQRKVGRDSTFHGQANGQLSGMPAFKDRLDGRKSSSTWCHIDKVKGPAHIPGGISAPCTQSAGSKRFKEYNEKSWSTR